MITILLSINGIAKLVVIILIVNKTKKLSIVLAAEELTI